MDALRKAEQQKQKISAQGSLSESGTDVAAHPHGSLALEPLPRQEAAAPETAAPSLSPSLSPLAADHPTLPELPSSLEALDEQFLAHAAQSKPVPPPRPAVAPPSPPSPPPIAPPSALAPATPKPEGAREVARESARNVFEAKQAQPRSNRNFAIAVGLISLVAVIGIGVYFWWQLQPKSSLVATRPAASVTPTPATPSAPAAPVSPPAPAATAVATPPTPAAQSVAVPPAPTFSTPVAAAKAEPDEDTDERTPPPPRRDLKTASAKQPLAATPVPQPESPVRKTTTTEKTDPLLVQAHAAYGRGETELARQSWQKVLAKDPRNLDALRGLAVVAQQNQQFGDAVGYYQRALDVDPKDAIALAGLMALKVPTDMVQAESRLKTLLAEQPDSAYLNFALGNQFARQQRWADAQQAYFKAYTAEPGNPGYIFNLAVSLDQLRQPKLAARYYHEALAAAERQPGQPTGFDQAEVMQRLNQLQATVTP